MKCYKCGFSGYGTFKAISEGKYLCSNCYGKDLQSQLTQAKELIECEVSTRKNLEIVYSDLKDQNENMKCCGNCEHYDSEKQLCYKEKNNPPIRPSYSGCFNNWKLTSYLNPKR